MPLPKHVFDPPFNVVRTSHVVLDVTDLDRSLAFYQATLGLHLEDRTPSEAYLRGVEERQHHSLVLKKTTTPACERIGFKVGSDEDLDKAAAFLAAKGLRHAFVDVPYQGRTLQAIDPFGTPLEFYFKMEQRERLLQLYGHYKGVQAQRLDHFNIFSPELQDADRLLCAARFPHDRVHRGGRPRRPHHRGLDAPQGQRPRSRVHQRRAGRGCTIWPIGCPRRCTLFICAT